ncbi:polysaccharide lyase [Flavobacterium mesophilum]|uniref:polysaccharide lyase n=1 Tax=Flavobacterium mesophilum TaxID=3143495 RepID=UPI0031D4398A
MKKLLKLSSLLLVMTVMFYSCGNEQDLNVAQNLEKDEQPIVNNDGAKTAKTTAETAAVAALAGSAGARTITLQTNTLSCPGGLCTSYGVWSEGLYTVWFQMKFNSGFYWSRGGKCGYGILIGDQNTGGDPGWDGNGGSARFMWYCPNGSNTAKGSGAYLQPYVYYKDQPGQYGNDFGKKYYIQEGVTYNCQISVKLNTGSNTDGYVKYYVNGTEILNQKIRWVTNDAKRNVNAVSLHTFRGGSQDYWTAPVTSSIYYPSASWDAK